MILDPIFEQSFFRFHNKVAKQMGVSIYDLIFSVGVDEKSLKYACEEGLKTIYEKIDKK